MPDEAAVLDAPIDTETEQPDLSAEPAETPVESEPTETEHPEGSPTQQTQVTDGKHLSAPVKAALETLKQTNPATAKAMYRSLFQADAMLKAAPGGIKEIQDLRQMVEDIGGKEGIDSLRSEVQQWNEFDQLFTAADPKAIDFITADDASREAFMQIAPAAFAKFAQLNPEGWGAYMAQAITGDMQSPDQNGHSFVLDFQRLADHIADNPKAAELYNRLGSYMTKLWGLSRKAVVPERKAATAPIDQERQKFEQERAQFERQQWKAESARDQQAAYKSEWDKLAVGRKLTDTQTQAIQELFSSRLDKIVNSQYGEKLERYFAAKDKSGFLRLASTISSTEVPKALRAAFEAIVPSKPGPKPGAAAKAPTPVSRGTTPVPGFEMVASAPASSQIDYRNPFNTPANYSKGQAILRDGKKVRWAA